MYDKHKEMVATQTLAQFQVLTKYDKEIFFPCSGEHMSEAEVVESLMTLLGHCQDPERDGAFSQDTHTALEQGLPRSISAAQFAENILQLTLESPTPSKPV